MTPLPPSSAPRATVVEISDGGVVLGGRPILRHLDLAVHAGEVVAVLGANGSGKSTLVRALLGLTPLRTGSVRLFGTDLAHFTEHRRVGYVPQRITATTGVPASVREVVTAGRLAHRRAWQPLRAVDRRAVQDALEAVDLADRAKDGTAVLSGGQQQRVLIARALAAEPDLLVLDEPTAGVDLTSQESFAAIIERLVARGTTILLVAHEMGPLAPLITRTVVMREGRVAYDGDPLGTFHDVPHSHAHHPPTHQAHDDYSPDVRGPLEVPRAQADGSQRPQDHEPRR
ncbi:ABC transporter ATP-binding protein [Nocardioides sp. HDW12B]|uniref:metal ABC transporter ATP-binding protein n=1 Tax=Nocardioides sp. HDW12B TaxID=2714939 RepID=UPI00140E6BCB|nr:ABC transporter ATP-binding protein [Nocardioides sp. HDW12B]QIK65854.1 ABC transporter ATP-binding protein [Nocardioides sp. HDW12B]